MKKLLISIPLLFVIIFVATTPFSWFKVAPGVAQNAVYLSCGKPDSTDLWDIKGEYWERKRIIWEWAMYVGFDEGNVSSSWVYLDIGVYPYNVRLYVMSNGKIDLHM